jgi:hypothetical protein
MNLCDMRCIYRGPYTYLGKRGIYGCCLLEVYQGSINSEIIVILGDTREQNVNDFGHPLKESLENIVAQVYRNVLLENPYPVIHWFYFRSSPHAANLQEIDWYKVVFTMSADKVSGRVSFSNPIFRKPERYLIDRVEMIRKHGRPIIEHDEGKDRQHSLQTELPIRMLRPQ